MNREAQHVLDLIIKPLLPLLGMDSESARLLMVYTGEVETSYDYLRQVLESGNYGPAIGWWQMEEATFNSLLKYLNKEPDIRRRVLSACYLDIMPPYESMTWNLRFACAMARVNYWQYTEKLPQPNDLEGLAKYWLKYYNGNGQGKGTVERFMSICKNLVITV